MRLLFASNNAHKLKEVREILPEDVCVLSLQDAGYSADIDETGETLEENSAIKARTIAEWAQDKDLDIDGVFADDTGLEIHALGGKPGVRTARWAGEDCRAENNRAKALRELEGVADRTARFRTVVTLIRNHQQEQVEGIVAGRIATAEAGEGGFGYDPVFIPEGYDKTFAELPADVKNHISHRARAMEALRKILMMMLVLLLPVAVMASEGLVNHFRIYPSYANTTALVPAEGEVVGLSSGAIYTIETGTLETTLYDKTRGLSGSTASHIGYDALTDKVIITYTDGHIDIMRHGILTQMPDIYLKSEEINTTINYLEVRDGRAYLSMTFGIVALNLEKEEVIDTYPISNGVLYTANSGDTLWAVSSSALLRGNKNDNLIDYNSWSQYALPISNAPTIGGLVAIGSRLYLLMGEQIWRWNDGQWDAVAGGGGVRWIREVNGELLAANSTMVFRVEDMSSRFEIPGVMDVAATEGLYYLSLGKAVEVRNDQGALVHTVEINGPIDNMVYNLHISQGRLYIASGDYGKDRRGYSGSVKILDLDETHRWTNISEDEICNHIGRGQMPNFWDVSTITEDNEDPHHFFASSYGMGIVEFRDDKPYRHYTDTTITPGSTLANAVGDPKNNPMYWMYYTRCSGMTTDDNGYIWSICTQTTPLHIYDIHRQKWTALSLGGIIMDAPSRRIWIDKRNPNWKWMLFTISTGQGAAGVILLDDNGTPFNSADDRVLRRTEFVDQKGKTISPSEFYTLAQDNNGAIWIGTDKGPIIIEHENFFTSNRCTRIIRRRNDGTDLADYLLETEAIRAIAIDGGNRKWIGTNGSGLFVVSSNGQETVYEFTDKNSDLPSSSITALAIDPELGDVYIGTSNGLCSYRTDAAAGKSDMDGAYAYPNPVKPDYEGDIVISGLMHNSWVNIFDSGGNLVYKTMSNGGSALWNGTNSRGDRVASGVYSAVCTAADGGGQTVVKILMLR